MPPELTEDDLEVAEDEVEFAMQTCPVEGIVSASDGALVTFDDLEGILDKLRGMSRQTVSVGELDGSEILKLEALTDYTYENCPVENTATFHDGRQVSAKDIAALRDKLKALVLEPVPVP